MEKYGNFFFEKRYFFGDKIPVFSEAVLDTVSELKNLHSRPKVTYTIKNSSPYYKSKILVKFSGSVPDHKIEKTEES